MMRKTTLVLAVGALVAASLTGCAAGGSSTGAGETTSATEPAQSTPAPDAAAGAGCTGDLATEVPPVEVDVRLVDGAVEPAPDRIDVPLGTTVVLRAEVDTAADIHVHGYDVMGDAEPGAPACLEILADTPGVFDVEAHPETLLLQLAVR